MIKYYHADEYTGMNRHVYFILDCMTSIMCGIVRYEFRLLKNNRGRAYGYIWGLVWQKHVSRARISNYIPQILWDVIICPCPGYMLLANKPAYVSDEDYVFEVCTFYECSVKAFDFPCDSRQLPITRKCWVMEYKCHALGLPQDQGIHKSLITVNKRTYE